MFERNPDRTCYFCPTFAPLFINTWIWDFDSSTRQQFTGFMREDEFSLTNGVFSPDGKWALLGADCKECTTAGYAVGFVRVDFEQWLANPQVLE